MNRKIISWLTILIMFITSVFTVSVYADTEVDRTSPVLNSITVLDGTNITSVTEEINIQLDIIEEGAGVCTVEIEFEGISETFYYDLTNGDEMTGDLLFTGTHSFPILIKNLFPVGTHKMTSVALIDSNGNRSDYFLENDPTVFDDNAKLEVKEQYVPEIKDHITISKLNFSPTSDINAANSIACSFTIDSATYPIYYCKLALMNIKTEKVYYFDKYVSDLKAGTYTIKFPINNKLPVGEYVIESFNISSGNIKGEYHLEMTPYDNPEFLENVLFKVTKSTNKSNPLELKNITVNSNKITAPDILTITMDFVTNGNSLYWADVYFLTDYGKQIHFELLRIKKKDGKYYVNIPLSPFVAEGKLKLDYIYIQEVQYISDAGPDEQNYYFRDEYDFFSKADINVKTQFDIAYFGSLGNSSALKAVKKLKSGETAVLDCRYKKSVSKDYFTAIAGKNVTLALVDENVQWVFNGKNISKSKCKTINVSSNIKIVNGGPYGYSNDKKIALLIFKNNGTLPGEVDMRINHDYLAEKYNFPKTNMKLTYIDSNYNSFLEDSNVDVAGDNYYEYDVDHNSTFVLSKNKAKIGAPKLTSVPSNLSTITIKWTKTTGNGYYVYRATSKNGKYKKVKTIKSRNTTSYKDYNVKKGKSYYYKVKPYSKYSKYNKTAKTSAVLKTNPRLSTPNILSCKKVSGKTQIKVTWNNINWSKANQKSYYYIFKSTSKNGKYSKVAAVSGKNYYIDKRVKKGKTYYYKVKAVHKKHSSYNSNQSSYRSCKL